MRKLHMLVFDDFVTTGTSGVTTKPEYNDQLGSVDQLAIQLIGDQVNTTGTVTVALQHSADQQNWTQKNGTAEINAATLTAGSTNVRFGSDAGATPSLGYVRLVITIATTTQVHIKLWVTGRVQG